MSDLPTLLSQLSANQLTRRQFVNRAVGLGLSASVAAALAARGGQSLALAQGTPATREPATVTIWTWREQDQAVWQAAAQALQGTWPGLAVDVQVSEATEFAAKVSTAMQAGQGPDIITTRAGQAYFQPYAEANMFVPLTDKVPGIETFPAGTIDQVSYEGEVLAVPFASQIWLFYYNKKIFAEHGLTPPATWSDLMAICQTLRGTDITPLFVPAREGWVLSGYVDCVGATYLGNDYAGQLIAGEKTFTDEQFVNLLRRIKDMQPCFQEGYVGNNVDDMDAAFQAGRAAMILYGGWGAKTYQQQTPDLEFDFFLCPPDEVGGKQFSYVFVDGGYAVNAASKVKDAALEFVKYSATLDYGQTFANLTEEMSSVPGVTAPADNVHLQRQLQLAELGLDNLFRIRSPFDQGNPGISTLMHPLMQGLLSDQVSPEEVAQQLQEGVSQWYGPFQGS
ncbi:MAG: extracellular solute-binding protein [Chloroflexota bacterium]|nr:extracellular solute-binding protein [Chloroflexota bacterium]